MIRCNTLFVLTCLCAGHAAAQDSLSIYGTLDAGPKYVDDIRGGHQYSFGSGGLQPERIGFRGVENLGNGMKVDFRLESGVLTGKGSTVSPTSFFNREASLALSGSFGSLRLGRVPDLMYDYIPKYLSPPALTAIVNKHPGNWDNYASQYQFSGALTYTSPKFAGFQFGSQYGVTEQPGGSARMRNTSLGVTWTNGPVRAALVAAEHRNRPVDIAGRMGLSQAFGQELTPGTSVATDYVRNIAAGVSWNSASYVAGAAYSRTRMRAKGADATQHNIDIGGMWRITPVNALQAVFTHTRFDSAKWNELKVVGIHSFSRRSHAYIQAQYQRAGGAARFAAIQDIGVSSSNSQTVLSLGLLHSF